MSKTILQVPVSKELKEKAQEAAEKQGFSSVQESVRVFLSQFASGSLKVSFQPAVKLSSKAEKRYEKQIEDISLGKNVGSAKDVKDLVSKLNEA